MSSFPAALVTRLPAPSGEGSKAGRATPPPAPAGSPRGPSPAGPVAPGRAATGDLEWP